MRVAPFGAIAVLAEASLALAPASAPTWAVAVSVVLLAAGATSGAGIVLLVPLIWTALYQRRWESGCVLAAIVAVEVVISLTPVTAPGDVIARRVILWAALGTVLAVATHNLRDRSSLARQEAAGLHARLTELTVLDDRDRIAADLQDKVIQQVFSAGLSLYSTAMLATQPEVRDRIMASADDLDQVLRLTRDAVFGLEQRLQGHGLRAEIGTLFDQVSPAPELSFTGPVDGALDPARATALVGALRDALKLIIPHSAPSRVALATSGASYTAEVEATWSAPRTSPRPAWISLIEDSALQPGISVAVHPTPSGTRFTWSVPLPRQP